MKEEIDELIELLQESETELDAWKDMLPDRAGQTIPLLKKIRAKILKHRPEPDFGTAIN